MTVNLFGTSRIRFHYLVILGLLLVSLPQLPAAAPFSWESENLFERLEMDFLAARTLPEETAASRFDEMLHQGEGLLARFDPADTTFPEPLLARLATLQFDLGVLAAAHPTLLERFQRFVTSVRQRILPASPHWQGDADSIQSALYRLIYGGRAAVEEAWLQSGSGRLPSLLQLADPPAATPSAVVEGVRVHSGDILLSRAGAPTSALISRGNDRPGNFSHVALLYVDEKTHLPSIIEAHIERGVVISTLEQYLEDKKQRLVVLRLRGSDPRLKDHPMLPHDAAKAMLARAQKTTIPYDFAMDYRDEHKLFCSEVVYHAYRHEGIELWQSKTEMSQPGLRTWLADMGVKHFRTLAPSDIEYDPQLVVVAEWRDMQVLREDRLDSAIMDALLEEAEQGLRLGYPAYKLPLAAGVKLWSTVQLLAGLEPTIPKGMRLATALKVDSLVKVVFPLLRKRLREAADSFRQKQGYTPPYWSLLQQARQTLKKSLSELSPQLVRKESR